MTFVKASALTFSKDQVAVGLSHGNFGSHVGLAFHSAKDGVKLLHLRFHKQIASEDFPPTAPCWMATVPEIHATNAKALVGIARAVAKRNPSISFGINLFKANGAFDSNGHYRAPRGSDGLTCATFIAQIFHAAGLALVDIKTWAERSDDHLWGNAVCDLLGKVKADAEHIAAVRANINGIRLRPEEVAFSANEPSDSRPVRFAEAEAGGKNTMATLSALCPPPAPPAPPATVSPVLPIVSFQPPGPSNPTGQL